VVTDVNGTSTAYRADSFLIDGDRLVVKSGDKDVALYVYGRWHSVSRPEAVSEVPPTRTSGAES
jgi:hypothetical protein